MGPSHVRNLRPKHFVRSDRLSSRFPVPYHQIAKFYRKPSITSVLGPRSRYFVDPQSFVGFASGEGLRSRVAMMLRKFTCAALRLAAVRIPTKPLAPISVRNRNGTTVPLWYEEILTSQQVPRKERSRPWCSRSNCQTDDENVWPNPRPSRSCHIWQVTFARKIPSMTVSTQ